MKTQNARKNNATDALVVGEPVIQLVAAAYRAGRPVLLEGGHGLGKSEVLGQAAKRLGIACTVLDLSLCEATDLVGLPQLRDGRTVFAPPDVLPASGSGLLVLEELNRAPRYVRAPCLQLLTARRLNQYILPDGWLPVACINPAMTDPDQDSYDVDELDAALRSRFVHVRVRAGHREWLEWAAANGVHAVVLDAVEEAGEAAINGPGVNPRAWVSAGSFLSAWESDPGDDEVLAAALVGILGETWGIALCRMYATAERPLAAHDVIDGWDTARPVVVAWVRQARLDMLRATWNNVMRHLSSNDTARDVALRPPARRACEAFAEALPADLGREAKTWLAGQFGAFSRARLAARGVGARRRARG